MLSNPELRRLEELDAAYEKHVARAVKVLMPECAKQIQAPRNARARKDRRRGLSLATVSNDLRREAEEYLHEVATRYKDEPEAAAFLKLEAERDHLKALVASFAESVFDPNAKISVDTVRLTHGRPELVSLADVARQLGVSRQRVHQLKASTDDFPEPLATWRRFALYDKRDTDAWIERLQERRAAPAA